MNITIRQIEAFLKVAECGSFTRAAERLHVAQPALSLNVRELEEALGIRLFDRTTRRVELTEGGREFREAAAKILEGLELAARHAHEFAAGKRGKVSIAAPPLLAAAVLPWAIADFRSQSPGVQVTVTEARTSEIVEHVRSGQMDCGIGTFRAGEDGIAATPLASDSLALFCPPAHPLTKKKRLTWRDLDGEPMIALTRDSGIRVLIELGCETAEIGLTVAYEVSQVTTALAMVDAGLGVSVLPTYAWVATHGTAVVALPLTSPTISRDIALITQAGRSVTPALSSFMRVLAKHIDGSLPLKRARAG